MSQKLLRSLPSIDLLLARPFAEALACRLTRDRVRDLLRRAAAELREEISNGRWPVSSASSTLDPEETDLTTEIERRAEIMALGLIQPSLKRVINATGVIIHTNLGRAPLAKAALDAIVASASGYSNLEFDLSTGQRGSRESHCQDLLARLVKSEAAVVTNNNAAAVLLVLNTLAEGGEVIVSRGELIEIGGSFRIPEVMEKGGARLREVGTTNRTRIGDYERAINEHTRLILRVHPSNYRIIGFTERPSTHEIAALAARRGIPSFEDLGSGCLIDLASHGVNDEPVVADSLSAGISVVSFSGDKLLGGPQAGVIAGSRTVIDRIRSNPLMRALRVDKITYAAIEGTLRLYERGVAEQEVPVLRAITAGKTEIEMRAARFVENLAGVTHGRTKGSLEDGMSVIGGGSAPGVGLPTCLIALEDRELSADALDEFLRNREIPIITRTERGCVLVDLRTVAADEEGSILAAFSALVQPNVERSASIQVIQQRSFG